MKCLVTLSWLVLLISVKTNAQNTHLPGLTGEIVDSATRAPLMSATVSLHSADDIQVIYKAFSNSKGFFSINVTKPGVFIVNIRYVGYMPKSIRITITDSLSLVLGVILMNPTGIFLKEVEVKKQKDPIVIKKDTTEFDAGAFSTPENALLGELFKRLPGLEIGADGKLRFNGQVIEDVMVNGRSFFTNDPAIVSSNLLAEMVEKIQVMDKNSGQNRLTVPGISKNKLINIVLKDKYNDILSGKITGGYGNDNKYASNVNLNNFKNKAQWSIIGSADNTNGQGVLENNTEVSSVSGVNSRWQAGANIAKDLGKKATVSLSYTIGKNTLSNDHGTFRQNIIEDSAWNYKEQTISRNSNFKHQFNAGFEKEFDSSQRLSIRLTGDYTTLENFSSGKYNSYTHDNKIVNNGQLVNIYVGNTFNLSGIIRYTKKFSRERRRLSIWSFYKPAYTHGNGTNISHNFFVEQNGALFRDSIDQQLKDYTRNDEWIMNIQYAEPLFKNWVLEIGYEHSRTNANLGKKTYDYDNVKNAYDKLNDSLSNEIVNVFSRHNVDMGLVYINNNINIILALNSLFVNMKGSLIGDEISLRSFYRFIFPKAEVIYSLAEAKYIVLSYQVKFVQPAINQFLPVPDNRNPLFVHEGNPGLKPTLIREIGFGYNNLQKIREGDILFGYLIFRSLRDKNVDEVTFDSLGLQRSKPVNVNGAYELVGDIVKFIPIRTQHTYFKINTNATLLRDISYVNNIQTANYNITLRQTFGYTYVKKGVFDLDVSGGAIYQGTHFEHQSSINYFIWNFTSKAGFQLPWNLRITANMDYMANTGRSEGYNSSMILVNASISKTILKREQGLFSLAVYDIFNQNKSINRSVGISYVEDTQSQVLQRFALLKFTYFFKPTSK